MPRPSAQRFFSMSASHALACAVEKNDSIAVEEALAAGADPNVEIRATGVAVGNGRHLSLLAVVMAHKNEALAESLLAAGADPVDGTGAWKARVEHGTPEQVFAWLDRFTPLRNKRVWEAFQAAAHARNLPVWDALFDRVAATRPPSFRPTRSEAIGILMDLTRADDALRLKAFLGRFARHLPKDDMVSVLRKAMLGGHKACSRQLVDWGVSPCATNAAGSTGASAFDAVVDSGRIDCIEASLPLLGKAWTPHEWVQALCRAIYSCPAEWLDLLWERSPLPPNERLPAVTGRPLRFEKNKLVALSMLEAVCADGATRQAERLVRTLVKKGFRCTDPTHGQGPLRQLFQHGVGSEPRHARCLERVARLLLRAGADWNAAPKDGKSAWAMAMESGDARADVARRIAAAKTRARLQHTLAPPRASRPGVRL